MKGIMHHRLNCFAHIALDARKALPHPIAKSARLRRPATDIVERDRSKQSFIQTHDPSDKQRHGRVTFRNSPLRPIHAVGKALAGQVGPPPRQAPKAQGNQSLPSRCARRPMRESQLWIGGRKVIRSALDPDFACRVSKHQAARRVWSFSSSGAAAHRSVKRQGSCGR